MGSISIKPATEMFSYKSYPSLVYFILTHEGHKARVFSIYSVITDFFLI